MEKKLSKKILASLLLGLLVAGCSSKFLKYEKASDLKKNDEFSQAVKIDDPTGPADAEEPEEGAVTSQDNTVAKPVVEKPAVAPVVTKKKPTPVKKAAPPANTKSQKTEAAAVQGRQPDIEDASGFEGRRPVKDPFRVGERVVHKVQYEAAIFNFTAGTLTMKVNPYATVNAKQAYSLDIAIKTSSFFASYYSVDDKVRTYMDYETLVPTTFTLHVKESKQLREAQMYFDFNKNQATYWEKKYTEKNGQEEKKQQWDILPYSQNVFSAAYYMRVFEWKDGKEYAFRVADDNENLVFKGKVVGRETLKTEAGTFKAIKIKPEFSVKGVFKPVGDIFIWLSDDDRKYILRIESKIKIGSIVSEISELNPGK